jgi:hypothetical protein
MKLSDVTVLIIKRIGIITLILIAAGIILLFAFSAFSLITASLYALGVIITSALNCFKIIMIERTAVKLSEMDKPEVGKGYAFFQYVIRYFLTAIVVGLVVLIMYLITGETPFLSLDKPRSTIYDPMIIGLVVGLFTLKIAVVSANRKLRDM